MEDQAHLRFVIDHQESADEQPPVEDALLIILPFSRQRDVHGISGALKERTRPKRKSFVVIRLLRSGLVQACRYIDFFIGERNFTEIHIRHKSLHDRYQSGYLTVKVRPTW